MTTKREAQETGGKYRALVDLSYPTDPKVVKRIQSGEDVPFAERALKTVAAGKVAGDIPAVSIPWLLAQGLIEAVDDEPEEVSNYEIR